MARGAYHYYRPNQNRAHCPSSEFFINTVILKKGRFSANIRYRKSNPPFSQKEKLREESSKIG